jgi:histidyl-tRNA synthetase
MLTKAPKGTKDVLPHEVYKWHYVEQTIREIAQVFGYQEIRTPVFEHTELFERGVGDTTDIVQKEMYTFSDKGGRSITLKPEGTAGVVRAYIEHKLYAEAQPVKMYYLTPCYRYERPQAGRLREFHQFGIEAFGGTQASLDAEIITIAMKLFKHLGIDDLYLKINSIGCPKCRPAYHEKLKSYLADNLERLCGTCKQRFDKNPLRILDCKVNECRDVIKGVPYMIDNLCEECSCHFEELKQYLLASGTEYRIDPMIVRGLDYYTKTVFEIISGSIGSQDAICGGGRYDGLVQECGGPGTPGVGFGLGLERLILAMENQGLDIPKESACDVFIATLGLAAKTKAFELAGRLRGNGIAADMDHVGRSLKAQFKYADKIGASWVCTIGDDELAANTIRIKEMATGNEEVVALDFFEDFFRGK